MTDPELAYKLGSMLFILIGVALTPTIALAIIITELVAQKRNLERTVKSLGEACSIWKQENLAMRSQLGLPPERRLMLEVEPEPRSVQTSRCGKGETARDLALGVYGMMGVLGALTVDKNSVTRDE
jgi:hypothetical protein